MKPIHKIGLAFFTVSVSVYVAVQTLVFDTPVKETIGTGLFMGVISSVLFVYVTRRYINTKKA